MSETLKVELERMLEADKAVRKEVWEAHQTFGPASPELIVAREKGSEIDRRHTARLVEILEEHGWPGRSRVGEAACNAAFLILQHSDLATQLRYFPMLEQATDAGEVDRRDLAMLEDRIRMRRGLPQVYGSQMRSGPDGKPQLWPIEDEAHVDDRRASVGLGTLAEYLNRVGLDCPRHTGTG